MGDEIKILMIDDDEEDFMIIKDLISDIKHRPWSIEWVDSYKEGLEKVLQQKHDIYLIDYRLGPDTGLDLIEEAVQEDCTLPMILLTGQNDLEVDQKAMEVGATDYLVKGFVDADLLERSIRYGIARTNSLNEIKTLNSNLEGKVKERTIVLETAVDELNQTKNELNEALEKEKELNDLKSRFVSMASHEFRTPLTSILSSLSLIRKYQEMGENEKQERHFERIKNSVGILTDILNDILSLSRLEEGKVEINQDVINIFDFINDIVEQSQEIAKEGQQITTLYSGNNPEIVSDKKILRHVMVNLVSNAIKYSKEDGKIEVNVDSSDPFSLVMIVKDNGIGISQEDQKHLFERFFRGKNVSNIQGTGLGLNIVAKYVEVLNGTIQLESELEKGTTITLTFKR